ncbi:hypothetical protein C2S51_037514 [Perilla frutescens var. frutescens]|nr:hypothetical protein C2S51_037514 [Perilla frutescens var. frutescens]
MAIENPVHYQLPVLEETISPSEMHELLSLLESEPTIHSTSSSETNRSVYSTEERKRRRMISNRESARRSRWRKKKLQEDLAHEVNRLKLENQELENWLSVLTHHCHLVQRDSNRLLSESIYLQHKLAGLNEILAPTMPLQ